MATFDPEAATAAYMATLSPEAHAKATAYTQGGHWLLLWGWLIGVLAAFIIIRWGILPRIRSKLSAAKPHPNSVAFACVAAFVLVDWLIELPWAVYARWWRERSYGLTTQAFAGWFGEALINIAIGVVITGLFFVAIYALIRRAPRTWWIWSGGVSVIGIIVLVVLAPIFIEPLFNKYTPAPPGEVRDQVVAMAKEAGVPSDKIYVYNGSKQSERYTANVSGLFGTARVAMSDTMFKQGADLAEVRGVVGHEMGHYVRHHILWTAAALSLLAILTFWLTDRLFPLARRWMGADGLGGIGDPATFPVLVVVVSTLGLLATPITNSLTRVTESDADAFSLRHAHEPDGLSKALVKTIAYRASSPSVIEETIFYDHPSVQRRVHRAMLWKAAHPDLVGK